LANHTLLAHQFDNIEQQREAETLGMWTFLATEILIFGAMFVAYATYRFWYPHDFEAASSRLNVLIGGVNTLVLLTSSLTMALGVYACQTGKRDMLVTCLVLTLVLGGAFLGLKLYEYYTDYRDSLVPGFRFPPRGEEAFPATVDLQHVQLMLMFYYILTGLHFSHMSVGMGLLVWLVVRARRGELTAEHYIPVEVVGLYWHFVDIVWIFLLPLLYLTGTHHLHELHL